MSNDTNPRAKMQTLVGVLMGMGAMAAVTCPAPGLRSVRIRVNRKTHQCGAGEGFEVPDQDEAVRICEQLDHDRRAKWMERHLTTHADRLRAIQSQDIEKSRRLVAERKKAARAAKRMELAQG